MIALLSPQTSSVPHASTDNIPPPPTYTHTRTAVSECVVTSRIESFVSYRDVAAYSFCVLQIFTRPDNMLTELYLFNNDFGDVGAQCVANALLEPHCRVRRLVLCTNGITSVGASAIAASLDGKNSALVSLDLNRNPVGDEGATSLASALIHNTTLTSLSLREAGVGASGGEALLRAVHGNDTLTRLGLEGNPDVPPLVSFYKLFSFFVCA